MRRKSLMKLRRILYRLVGAIVSVVRLLDFLVTGRYDCCGCRKCKESFDFHQFCIMRFSANLGIFR